MSAYASVKTECRDKEALCAALRDLGWPIEVHEQAQAMRGYQGVLGPKAHIIVRHGAHADAYFEDMGFELRDGAYVAHLSTHLPAGRANQIRQRYARHALVAQAARQGYRVTEQAQPNGAIRLQLVRR